MKFTVRIAESRAVDITVTVDPEDEGPDYESTKRLALEMAMDQAEDDGDLFAGVECSYEELTGADASLVMADETLRDSDTVLERPVVPDELTRFVDADGVFSAVVPFELYELLSLPIEWFADALSAKAFGSAQLLDDLEYRVDGRAAGDKVLVEMCCRAEGVVLSGEALALDLAGVPVNKLTADIGVGDLSSIEADPMAAQRRGL